MKKIIYIFPCLIVLFFQIKTKAQQVSWGQINSHNIINIIETQNPDFGTYSSTIQIGNNNSAELFINEKTSIALRQTGDFNTLLFNNSFTDQAVKTSITTQGYNNIVDITGSNSISDKMKLTVKGDNVTIFMRNY